MVRGANTIVFVPVRNRTYNSLEKIVEFLSSEAAVKISTEAPTGKTYTHTQNSTALGPQSNL